MRPAATVIGNLALDETLAVEAMPDAGASLLARRLSRDIGGKGANQAVVLSRFGIRTRLVAALGSDADGELAARLLGRERLSLGLVRVDAPTDRSTVLRVPSGDNAVLTVSEAAEAMPAAAALEAVDKMARPSALLLQGNLCADLTGALLRRAGERGILRVFNPSPVREAFAALLPGCDILCLNETEAQMLCGRSGEAALARLLEAGAGRVVLTQGAAGATMASADGVLTAPAAPADVVDTTGAGDTFLAAFLACGLHRGTFGEEALGVAARAASLTVSRAGTLSAFPTAAEAEAILGG